MKMERQKIEIKTDIREANLREAWEGFTGFTVKAKDTSCNQKIHERFKTYCKDRADNSYTVGLDKLLDIAEADFKYSMLSEKLDLLQQVLDDLKGSVLILNEKETKATAKKAEPQPSDEDDGDVF